MHQTIDATQLHVFQINDCERHWVAAETADEASDVYLEQYGCKRSDLDWDIDPPIVDRLDDDTPLTVSMRDEAGEPSITKTARQWCEDGKGVIATTEEA